ncbi:protein kinase C-binding protein NELL1-like [Mizuhopecten yessoensis]|uniref:Protein kinase C-binding protein NELL1 n=1 Tax=Mizuhopecten yessoensis TaxID=6573 RepID=A0A210Q1Z5_MIZYE|nr:protein kinase C-binding protein NELL1-like [Mizuhopecten yessoensis]OWF42735.1 Protein kinase C-binding protein NELL1 [Mizuhopecten yessoensis]
MGPSRYDNIAHILVLLFGLIIYGVSLDLKSRHVLDLLQFLNTTANSGRFTVVASNGDNTSAILLEDPSRNLALPNTVLREAFHILRENSEVTFLATVKQEVGDAGSIIAFSSDVIRFLEIESSGRRDEIRFHYTHDQQTLVETFPYRLADNQWHKLALSLSGTHVKLFVDCNRIYERVIKTVDRSSSAGTLKLYVGQRNGQHALFRGALQDVKIVTQAHGYLLQCPQQDTACPTCAQYQALEQQVKNMYSLYQNLSLKLLRAEEKIFGLEQCECLKSCSQNGTLRKEGEVWQLDQCTVCRCANGTVECQKVDCPPVRCENPIYRDGECCPICLTNCFYSGKYYDHGQSINPRMCVTCTCDDGRMACTKVDPETNCEVLNCPVEKQLHIKDECCPVCEGTDFCSKGHECHENAVCVNMATRYGCQCKIGFTGDGHHCEDIDECQVKGGKRGHHCNGNTKCINTIGSYTCKCPSGETPADPYKCEEQDECSSGTHSCDTNADCVDTSGSYTCHCRHGYTGDGYTCSPVCDGSCLNGGACIAPSVCECRHGYIGMNCELDIDECAIEISACSKNSICVDTPGWYHCDCIEGFHSSWPDNRYGSLCMDINECAGEGNGHTCHPSTKCHNLEGSYECRCQPGMPCIKQCRDKDSYHDDGSIWTPSNDKCMECTCKVGITTCHKRECDCSNPHTDYECCLHCDKTSQCRHQEVPLMFDNGERWIYQCQTCECLEGEIDCWPLQCPKITCHTTVLEPGDCCPRCVEDNPCASQAYVTGGADNSATTCLYKGHAYTHGDTWALGAKPCSTCECRVGHICCLYNQNCTAIPD